MPGSGEVALREAETRVPEKLARRQIAMKLGRGERHLDGNDFANVKDSGTSGCSKIHLQAASLARDSAMPRKDSQQQQDSFDQWRHIPQERKNRQILQGTWPTSQNIWLREVTFFDRSLACDCSPVAFAIWRLVCRRIGQNIWLYQPPCLPSGTRPEPENFTQFICRLNLPVIVAA
jgi:hypothetical protein